MVEVLKMSLKLTGPFKNFFYLAKCNSSGIQSQNFAAVLLLENWLSWFNFEITQISDERWSELITAPLKIPVIHALLSTLVVV